jgi:archaellum component FlaC
MKIEHKKLSKTEISKLKGFLDEYGKIWESINRLEYRLGQLEQEKELILSDINKASKDLETLRIHEDKYQKTITAKYGEIVLDLETFEYKPS